jgi:hypothetical protein
MARALELPRFSGTRRLHRLRPNEDLRAEQWLPVRSFDRPPWLKEVFDRLNELGTLGANWDSYASDAVTVASIRSAKTLLSNLQLERLPKPHVSAAPGGGVGFHWRVARYDLEIEVNGDSGMSFLKTDLANPALNDEGEIASFKVTQEILDWLIAG